MTNYMIHSKVAGTLRKEHSASSGSRNTATYATGALQVSVAAFGVISKKVRNDL